MRAAVASLLVASIVALGPAGAVRATGPVPDREPALEEEAEAPAPRDLEVRLRVSSWAAAWGGDVDARGAETHVSAPLDEAFELDNLGAAAELDVRWRRLLLVAGGSWVDLDDDLETPAVAGPVPPFAIPLPSFDPRFPLLEFGLVFPELLLSLGGGDVDVDVQRAQGDLLLGYQLVSAPLPRLLGGREQGESRRFEFDLLAGVRYYDVETRIDVSLPAAEIAPFVATIEALNAPGLLATPVPSTPELIADLLPLFGVEFDLDDLKLPVAPLSGYSRRFEADAHWLDPVIGVRMGLDVSDCLRLRLRGDVGGFGLGSASDFAWTAEVGFVVRLTAHWEAELAWLAAGLDRDRGAGALDFFQHGPRVGLAYRF